MRKRHFILSIAASVSLLSACGSKTKDELAEHPSTSKIKPVMRDVTADYEEVCLNGTVHYQKKGASYSHVALFPKVLTQQKLFGDTSGPAPGYHVSC